MPSEFVPDEALFNPQFYGYDVERMETAAHVFPYPLPGKDATQSTISSEGQAAQRSFKEVQNRIRHNHLYPAGVGNQAGYINGGAEFIIISYDFVGVIPSVDDTRLTTCLSTVIA